MLTIFKVANPQVGNEVIMSNVLREIQYGQLYIEIDDVTTGAAVIMEIAGVI